MQAGTFNSTRWLTRSPTAALRPPTHLHFTLADQLVGQGEQRVGALRAVLSPHELHQGVGLEPHLQAREEGRGRGWVGGCRRILLDAAAAMWWHSAGDTEKGSSKVC